MIVAMIVGLRRCWKILDGGLSQGRNCGRKRFRPVYKRDKNPMSTAHDREKQHILL